MWWGLAHPWQHPTESMLCGILSDPHTRSGSFLSRWIDKNPFDNPEPIIKRFFDGVAAFSSSLDRIISFFGIELEYAHRSLLSLKRKNYYFPPIRPSQKIFRLLLERKPPESDLIINFFLDHFPRYLESAVGDKKPAEVETVAPVHEDKLPFSLAKNS